MTRRRLHEQEQIVPLRRETTPRRDLFRLTQETSKPHPKMRRALDLRLRPHVRSYIEP